MELRNLTPHRVVIRLNERHRIVIPESDAVARVKFGTRYLRTINEVPVHERIVERINGLPSPRKGVMYIVSSMLQDNLDEDRDDIVSPDTLCDSWMSHDGRVMEVSKLVRFYR